MIDAFCNEYNHHRPHRSLPHRATPAAVYTTRPKATPGEDHTAEEHDRISTDTVDKAGSVTLRHNGRLHHIGIGRTRVILIVHGLDIRVVHAITGELIRHPTLDYQPTGRPKGSTR